MVSTVKLRVCSLTNIQYVKLMKAVNLSHKLDEQTILLFLKHYDNIIEPKNHFAINKVLKICSNHSCAAHKIVAIWDEDIKHTNNLKHISHELLLKSCSTFLRKKNISLTDIQKCIAILKSLQLPNKMPVQCALINAFGLSRQINNACKTFNNVPTHKINASLVCALMTAHINNKDYATVISVYKQYHSLHDEVAHLLAIKAALNLNDFNYGHEIIHALNINSYHSKLQSLFNAIIGFYGRMGDIRRASTVFELIPVQKRDIVSITMMMNAFSHNGMNKECFQLFQTIISNKNNIIKPNKITFVVVLKACIHETALNVGLKIHKYLKQNSREYEHILHSLDIQTKFICLYGKANRLDLCHEIFAEIKTLQYDKYMNEIKLWNQMISAYGKNGQIHKAVKIFNAMINETFLTPNEYTILHLCNTVNACDDLEGISQIKAILNEYVFKKDDLKCFDLMNMINNMSRQQLLDTLHLFILCVCVKEKVLDHLQQNENIKNNVASELCSFPVFQLKHGHIDNFTQILLTVNNNKHLDNEECINTLIETIKSFDQQLTCKEYLAIIDAFGSMQCTNGMIKEYKNMLSSGIRLNRDILICILHHCIRHGEPEHIADIWMDILSDKEVRLNSAAFQSLILCINKTKNFFAKHILLDMWHLAVNEQNVKLSLHCYCLAVLSFSRYFDEENRGMAKHLLCELSNNESMLALLATNKLQFIQILDSYGNLGQVDEMCSFYHNFIRKWKNGKHDIDALILLASQHAIPKEILHDIFNIVEEHFNLRELSVDHLINFHRVAVKYEDESMKQKVWTILEDIGKTNKIKLNIVSHFTLNEKVHLIPTGYEVGGCDFDSHYKVDRLMQEIGYNINTTVCPELSTEIARQRHLKSHSEKKALAILLSSNCNEKNVKIKVTRKMCQDCHEFFCQVSKFTKYDIYNIQCIDPKGIHNFKNGICYLCQH